MLAGAKVVQSMGFISEYRWAFGFEDLLAAVSWKGPVVIGVNWYEGMFDTDEKGLLHPTGRVMGGHCVEVDQVSVREETVGGPNSWGLNWGVKGRWKMTWTEFARLLNEDGEACVPIRTAKKAA